MEVKEEEEHGILHINQLQSSFLFFINLLGAILVNAMYTYIYIYEIYIKHLGISR